MRFFFSRSWLVLFLFLMNCDSDAIVTIQMASQETLQVRVELAETAQARAQGLMFRQNLPEGTGMLFIFPTVGRSSFWMRNTPIALDMIFIREEQIVDVIENAVPYSDTLLTPDADYDMVLEVPGGYSARHGLQLGDSVQLKR